VRHISVNALDSSTVLCTAGKATVAWHPKIGLRILSVGPSQVLYREGKVRTEELVE
jgi:hypothetical protein